jgi:hypothetical protein
MTHRSNRAHPALASRALSVLMCSTLLSPAAWAGTVHVNAVHVNIPAIRVKPVVVRVKPTIHLPASAGLGKQHLSKGSTGPYRHGPDKGDTANDSNAPAGSPVGYIAGPKGTTKGGPAPSSPGIAGKPPAGTMASQNGAPAVGEILLQTLFFGPDWFANTRNGIGGDPARIIVPGECDTCDPSTSALAAGVGAYAGGLVALATIGGPVGWGILGAGVLVAGFSIGLGAAIISRGGNGGGGGGSPATANLTATQAAVESGKGAAGTAIDGGQAGTTIPEPSKGGNGGGGGGGAPDGAPQTVEAAKAASGGSGDTIEIGATPTSSPRTDGLHSTPD